MSFFRTFGKGLLYILISPFVLAVFCLYFVYSIFVYFIEFIIACIKFFKGEKLSLFLKEDQEVADLILKNNVSDLPQNNQTINNTQTNNNNNTTNQTIINNYYVGKDFVPNSNNTAEPKQISNPISENLNPLEYNEPKTIAHQDSPKQINSGVLEPLNNENGNANQSHNDEGGNNNG